VATGPPPEDPLLLEKTWGPPEEEGTPPEEEENVLEEIPNCGQRTSFVRLEYRISTPILIAVLTSGFQSRKRMAD
jgi:hypothetical protein